MKRLLIFTALVIAATVTPCTAALFRAVVPAGTPVYENQVLWVIFAPQPEPPRVERVGPDGRTIQVLQGSAISSLDVWVLWEGATYAPGAGPSWHLNGSARMGVELSPFYLNVGQRLQSGGVLGAWDFEDIGGLPSSIALPPGAPSDASWLGGRFSVGCPPPEPGTNVPPCPSFADPNEVEVWVDTGVPIGWVPSGSPEGVDPGGTTEGLVPVTPVPVTAVPEPTTLLLLGAALAGLGSRLRWRG